ncbi:MAG: tetratricopeptide repeat protein [Planctomycetota bacterium]|jgi:tetratricopeptide (TPR) repeat protein
MKRALVTAALFLFLVPVTRSEVVTLKTGEKIRGKIVSRDNGKLVIESPKGRTEVDMAKVSGIEERDALLGEFRSRIGRLPDTDADGFYRLSKWCGDKGLFEIGSDVLLWVIGIDPDHEDARKTLGYYRTRDGNWVQGQGGGGETAKGADELFKKALKFYEKGDDEKAIELIEKILGEYPGHQDATFLLGDIYLTSGQVGHARREFESLVKADPSNPWGHYGIALVRIEAKKFTEAAAAAQHAITLTKDILPPSQRRAMESEFYYVMGMSHRYRGASGNAEAERAFKESVDRNRRHFRAWTELGILYGAKGKSRDAFSAFAKALSADRTYVPARFNWGVALYRSGNQKDALIKLKPLTNPPVFYIEALKIVGRCYHRFNDFERARQYYTQYINNGGKDTKVNEWLREVRR